MARILFALILLTLPVSAQSVQTVSGYASITDGDTLSIGDVKVRIAGIDAPERHQLCGHAACGTTATDTLARIIAGDVVTCVLNGGRTYDRMAGTCSTARVSDLGGAMVVAGYAMDEPRYQPDYSAQTAAAARVSRGMWANPVQPGWQWRAAQRSTPAHDADCAIKGNISANGRIYHVPGSRNYDRTRISAGERWFCSIAEAESAGWRAPR